MPPKGPCFWLAGDGSEMQVVVISVTQDWGLSDQPLWAEHPCSLFQPDQTFPLKCLGLVTRVTPQISPS